MMKSFTVLTLLLASAQGNLRTIKEKEKKLPNNSTQNGRFGYSVDINANYMIVGCPYDYVREKGVVGSAFIYNFDGAAWNERAQLTSNQPHVYDGYGMSVAMTDSLAVVGSPFDDENGVNSGAVYIYKFVDKKWIFDGKILPDDGKGGYQFGYAVAIIDKNIVVGSPALDEKELNGFVYIYTKNNDSWEMSEKLQASDDVKANEFGFSVAIDDSYLAISAHWKNSNVLDSGVVFVYKFENNKWTENSVILPPNPTSIRHPRNFKDKRRFGTSIDIQKEYMVIGSPSERPILGGAYVYKKINKFWIFYESLKQKETDLNGFNFFGRSVSIDGDTIAVGSPTTNGDNTMSGCVYLFEKDGFLWTQKTKLVSSDATKDHGLGASVAMQNGNIIAGSVNDGDEFDGNGAAYIFHLPP